MKRSEIRTLIQSAVDEVSGAYRFNSGRITEFNSNRSNEYPFVWLEPLQVATEITENQLPIDDWECIIHIAQKDAMDSKPEQYEAIVDECDYIAQKLLNKINNVVNGYKLLTLTGITRVPFIHKQADDTSGVILSFTINLPDTTNVC